MKVLRGVVSVAAQGRFFPISCAEAKRLLEDVPSHQQPEELVLELRNGADEHALGHLLVEFERGFALTLYSLPSVVPEQIARTSTAAALMRVLALPPLETTSYRKGSKRSYRGYFAELGKPVTTELTRKYAVGRYRSSDSLATASKPKVTSETERQIT